MGQISRPHDVGDGPNGEALPPLIYRERTYRVGDPVPLPEALATPGSRHIVASDPAHTGGYSP